MQSPLVSPIQSGSCHTARTLQGDRELRCSSCGNRMFASNAEALLVAGLRCSPCLGELCLIPLPPE
jgi:hypothetical protein